jgi:hypothetical protein
MKKINLLILAFISVYLLAGINTASGFSGIKPVNSPAAVKYMQVSEFVKLSAKEYSALTGKKLNFFQKLSFNVTKAKMKRDLKKNPDLKLSNYINADGNTTFQIDVLWLFLGFLVGIGVVAAYLTKQEKYKITSAWIGFGLFVAGAIIFGGSIF